MNSFLPEGYRAPAGSNQFMKFQLGDNKFRILSEAIVGWEGWKNGKPFRVKAVGNEPCPIKESQVDFDEKYQRFKINHFWAFTVWEYPRLKEKNGEIKVLSLVQKGIMRDIENYFMADEWGDPRQYDLNVKRQEDGGKVTYQVIPLPPKPVAPEILEQFNSAKVDLEKLFTNEYPMEAEVPF